jgi:O-antigen ligase
MIGSKLGEWLWFPVMPLVLLASVVPLFTNYPYLSVAPGLGLLIMVTVSRRPEIALYLIVFLIPFGNFRELGGPLENIKIHWVLALVLLLVVAGRMLTDRSFTLRFNSNLWPWFLLFLVVSLLSTLFSDYKGNAAGQVMLTLVAMVFFALTLSLTEWVGITRHIPAVIAASVSLGSLFAVLGSVAHLEMFTLEDRSTGGNADPNGLAMQIIFGLPFVVFWLTHGRRPWVKVVASICLVINIAAMIGSSSRSGALVMMMTLVTLFVVNSFRIKPRQLGLLFAGMVAVVLVALPLLPQSFWERQASLVSSAKDRSLNRRGSYLIVAREAITQRPLLGYGPGAFRDVYASSTLAQRYDRKEESSRRFAHNTYVEVLVGTGLVGFIFFSGLLIRAIRNLTQARRLFIARADSYHADEVLHYLVAFLFLLLFMAMFSDVFQKFMLLSLGLSQVWLRMASDPTPRSDGP